ncbi:MAG: aldo/keto reductase [Anaerolineales bacterium]|jgi:predicted oxidoreductase
MKTQKIASTDLEISRIAYGCMNIGGSWDPKPLTNGNRKAAMAAVHAALDAGINFFDHADIYCRGKSEEVFAGVWQDSPSLRQKIILQTKCGIRFGGDPSSSSPARYDFSYEHILSSVEGSLKRLQTEYLDVLLLHRPDPLVEPEEVARAFDELEKTGKVRYFGVSNHTAAEIALLKKYVRQKIVFNQVEFNLIHLHLIDSGILFNQDNPRLTRNDDTLEYCRLNEIILQAWSPLAVGRLTGRAAGTEPENIVKTAALVSRLASEKGVPGEAILIAWILRHPAHIQPIIGTTSPERIRSACKGDRLELTREEWYKLFNTARGEEVP